MNRYALGRLALIGTLALVSITSVAEGQLCVGSPARPGELAVRGALVAPSIAKIVDPAGSTNLEVTGWVHVKHEAWAEVGWGYRSRGRADNDAHRVHGGVGYSFVLGPASPVSICPFARATYEADDLFTDPESTPVRRQTTVQVGAAAGRALAVGTKTAVVPFISLSTGFFYAELGRVFTTFFDAGLSLASKPGFILAQLRGIRSGDSLGKEVRFGAGLYF
ncbi:MAG: hypothetical protein HY703_01095 [Gemmatimonadetes bacterium]|nr:hypothetical protein [Gemmatimonadota bacterium]